VTYTEGFDGQARRSVLGFGPGAPESKAAEVLEIGVTR
jgi:hypothetical protein